jgi:hypothetical protein
MPPEFSSVIEATGLSHGLGELDAIRGIAQTLFRNEIFSSSVRAERHGRPWDRRQPKVARPAAAG